MATVALITYFSLVFLVGFFSLKKHISSNDFIIGSRSLNVWLTALAAHASDMSSWLFLAYPAAIYAGGINQSMTAIGLVFFMWLNWQLVAKKLRVQTEAQSTQTLSGFFEKSLKDKTGKIRLYTSLMSLIFYTVYISAGIYGIGLLSESLFGIPYFWGCLIGMVIIIPYVFFGGYTTLAWIDLFQGLFLMSVICLVPIYYMQSSKLPEIDYSFNGSLVSGVMLFFGWGLGYFGQPHIITKFMGIKNPSKINRSKVVGMSWMIISLLAATFVGLIGRSIYANSLLDPQTLFINLVKDAFSPFVSYFMLCAVIAATINATSSQLLVVASSFTEDLYHKFISKEASSDKRVLISRLAVIAIGILGFSIAYFKIATIYNLVLYAWSGLGAAFGPLVIYCLYKKHPNIKSAWAGLVTATVLSISWLLISYYFSLPQEPLLPCFILAFSVIIFSDLLYYSRRDDFLA